MADRESNGGGAGFYSAQNMVTNALVSGVLSPLLILIALVRFGLLIRILPLDVYGVFILLSSVVGQFDFMDGGMRQSLQRYIPQFLAQDRRDDVGRAVTATLFVMMAAGAGIAAVISVFAATGGVTLFGEGAAGAEAAFYVAAVALVVWWPLTSFEAAMEGINRFNEVQVLRLAAELARTGLVVWGALRGWPVETLFLVFLGPMVVVQLLLAVRVRRILGSRILVIDSGSMTTVREIFHYTKWVAAGQVGTAINGSLDKIVVGAALGLAALPIYHGLRQVLSALSGLSTLLHRIVLPSVSHRIVRDGVEAAHGLVLTGTRAQLAFVTPFIALIVVFAEPLLTYWAGPVLGAYATTMQVGALLFIVPASMKVFSRAASALTAEIKFIMFLSLGSAFLSTAMLYVLGSLFGVSGAFVSVLIAPIVLSPIWHVHLLGKLKIPLHIYFAGTVLPGSWPGLLVLAIGVAVMPGYSGFSSIGMFVLVAVIFSIVGFALSYLFGLDGRSRRRFWTIAMKTMRLDVANADEER